MAPITKSNVSKNSQKVEKVRRQLKFSKPFVWRLCETKQETRNETLEHVRNPLESSKEPPEIDNIVYERIEAQDEAWKVLLAEKRFACGLCDLKFCTEKVLDVHLALHGAKETSIEHEKLVLDCFTLTSAISDRTKAASK